MEGLSSDAASGGSTPAGVELQESDLCCQPDSAAGEGGQDGVLAQAALPSTKRQRSAPLPTLQESPACTPGASPDVSFGFAAAYEETLARHLGHAHKQRGEQQWRDCPGLLVRGSDQHGSGHDSQLSHSSWMVQQQAQQQQQQQLQGQLPGSFCEHSATGLVLQPSLTAEANRRSFDESSSCSRGTTPSCSSEGLSVDLHRGAIASDSFEFSRPHQAGEGAWDQQSPLLGKTLQG